METIIKIDSELYNYWPEFVLPEKRLHTLGPFLKGSFSNCNNLLDAALGIGCDSIFLIKEGFQVASNEIDYRLIEIASQSGKEAGISLNITNFNWLDLNLYFGTESFDGIFLLGNSICLLKDLNEIRKSIRNLYNILQPGGKLIIDERNFHNIRLKRRLILDGHYDYTYNIMYCGDTIIGRPISILEDQICFVYEKDGSELGRLNMYPFKKDELFNILEAIGFSTISVYSDLSKEYDPFAEFYTYVAKK